MTIVFLRFMQSCIGSCLWLIIAEIFPLSLRGIGAMFPVIHDQFGLSAAFFVFVFALMIAFAFTHFCVSETKGKSLEEIEQYFRSLDKSGSAA